MAISEQRLILFAMLSEFESDARDLIGQYVCPDHSIAEDIGQEAFERLVSRTSLSYTAEEFNERSVLAYLDIGDAIKALLSNRTLLPPPLAANLNKLAKQLEVLPSIRNRVMHRRPLEFDDLPLVTDILRTIFKSDKRYLPRTAAAFDAIASGRVFSRYSEEFSFETPPTALNNLPQADFDDTGFMGRREQIEELKKAISGPFPVITVLGVGGAGKSALALHVAYDILNDANAGFDAVIWTSAKTTRLTGADVEEIAGAISSSVGIAEAALAELGEVSQGDPFGTVRELLEHFKILLFIDNLETILDERVRAFVRDIPMGSKVVFTSRIGLGAYDFVVPIKNLDPKQASAYFRRVATVWKQNDLASANNEDISSFCVRLNHSPLGIKWFIQAVASGASPQRLLSNPQTLLTFCLENIIDKMSTAANLLLNVLAITGREQSPASLHYIAEIDTWEIEDALRELIASNLVSVIVSKFGEEDRYRISSLAQTYISRLHSPAASFQSSVRKRQAQLTALSERAESEQDRGFVFDTAFLYVRKEFSGTDSVAATYLRRAMSEARLQSWDMAFAEIDKAKEIAPSYFEVLRVEAQTAAAEGNTLRAQSAYEEAIALKPDYPPLAVWYAGFLVKALDSGVQAEAVLRRALEADQILPEVQIELARCLLYQHQYEASWLTLTAVNQSLIKNSRGWRMYADLLVQCCTRNCEDCLERGTTNNFVIIFERLRKVIDELPSPAIDAQVEKHLRNAVYLGRRYLDQEMRSDGTECVVNVVNSICHFLKIPSAAPVNIDNLEERFGGRIAFLPAGQPYGFLDGDDGQRLFFHRNNCITRSEFDILRAGTVVGYRLGNNSQGICADDVSIID